MVNQNQKPVNLKMVIFSAKQSYLRQQPKTGKIH